MGKKGARALHALERPRASGPWTGPMSKHDLRASLASQAQLITDSASACLRQIPFNCTTNPAQSTNGVMFLNRRAPLDGVAGRCTNHLRTCDFTTAVL